MADSNRQRDEGPLFLPLNRIFLNCCSCSVRECGITLSPPTSACMSWQMPVIGYCHCGSGHDWSVLSTGVNLITAFGGILGCIWPPSSSTSTLLFQYTNNKKKSVVLISSSSFNVQQTGHGKCTVASSWCEATTLFDVGFYLHVKRRSEI